MLLRSTCSEKVHALNNSLLWKSISKSQNNRCIEKVFNVKKKLFRKSTCYQRNTYWKEVRSTSSRQLDAIKMSLLQKHDRFM